MIYPTLKECMEECSRTGVLNYKGIGEPEYMRNQIGFIPRLIKE